RDGHETGVQTCALPICERRFAPSSPPKIARMANRLSRAALAALGTIIPLVGVAACNEGLQPTPLCPERFVGICGRVTFQGTEPDSTEGVLVVAYPRFPQSRNDLLTFQPFPPPP